MKCFRAFAVICVSLMVLTNPSFAKEKQREWQTGKVVDTNRDTTYAGSGGQCIGYRHDFRRYNIRERKWQFDGCVSGL